MRPIVLAGLLCAIACRSAPPEEQRVPTAAPDPLARFEGRWITRGPYTPVHSGVDQVYSIERAGDGWTITATTIRHPPINRKDLTLTRGDGTPTPLTWRDGALEFVDARMPERTQRITADVRDGRLILPAVVQRDERTWEYRSWIDGGVFQCEHDPHVVPTGAAMHPEEHWIGLPSSYRTSEADSLDKRGERVKSIEFWQRNPSGGEELCAEIRLEGWIEGPFIRMWNGSKSYCGRAWEHLDDAEWNRIRALPAGGDWERL